MGILAIRKSFGNNKGVTIMEILIVIAIAGVLAGLSTGPLLRWRANKIVEENANYLINDIERAKVEALRRGTEIQINFVDNGNTATTNFTKYRVTRYVSDPANPTDPPVEIVLWEQFIDSRIAATATATSLTFTPRGILKSTLGDITMTSSGRADLQRRIQVSRLSIVRSTTF